ncbi:ABC transporter substrate-binding protein [Actinomadura darangshiensis]|uniref:ABC transporter substrate-binding protein n=1 Tax=Actinomadura darangshiensis TaxID=705336 RepID=A0A4R5AQZ8_9ACTN|nr:ABC transporter substrate-binding protein [Actinomadura darangshiensis]TDD72802.1 ABC transporter substrate-binding protein [Actinomadura darangshiensis]
MKPRRRLVLPVVVLAVLGTGCGVGSGSGDRDTWKIGTLQCSTDCGFLRMAEEQGFFKRRGVDVEFVTLQSASQALPALASGEVDAVEQNAGAFFIASERGDLDASVIGSTMIGLPWAIYAKKGITDLRQLQHKSMAISSPTGLPATIANVMLARSGVSGKAMQRLNGGGNADRYRAVVAGTTDSASSPADYVPRAEKDGVNVVALASDIVPQYPRYSIIARNDRVAAKPQAVRRYLAGLMDGFRYAYAHPAETKRLAAKEAGTTSGDSYITYMHDLIVGKRLVDPDAGVNRQRLEYLSGLLVKSGQLHRPPDLGKLVDERPQRDALAMTNP